MGLRFSTTWQGLTVSEAYARIENVREGGPKKSTIATLAVYASQDAHQAEARWLYTVDVTVDASSTGITYADVYAAAKLRDDFAGAVDVDPDA